jgi:hypothetical protein
VGDFAPVGDEPASLGGPGVADGIGSSCGVVVDSAGPGKSVLPAGAGVTMVPGVIPPSIGTVEGTAGPITVVELPRLKSRWRKDFKALQDEPQPELLPHDPHGLLMPLMKPDWQPVCVRPISARRARAVRRPIGRHGPGVPRGERTLRNHCKIVIVGNSRPSTPLVAPVRLVLDASDRQPSREDGREEATASAKPRRNQPSRTGNHAGPLGRRDREETRGRGFRETVRIGTLSGVNSSRGEQIPVSIRPRRFGRGRCGNRRKRALRPAGLARPSRSGNPDVAKGAEAG